MRPEGMIAFSEALKVNQTLTNLNLTWNQIGNEEGIQSLSEALKINHTLICLNLSRNQIGAEGMQALSESLKSNQNLTHLNLSWNHVNQDVLETDQERNVQEFRQSLKINKSIIDLNFDKNKINKDDQNEIQNLVKRNLDLQKKLTKSVKDGNFQEFQELIKIEKIPLIYQSAPDQEIISKRNFFIEYQKMPKQKKSAIDLLNPNEILIQDFKNYYDQFITSSSSNFNNNEKSTSFPNKLIAEKEIMLMRIGKEWKTIKNEFKNELTKKQKKIFLKWLYCPKQKKNENKNDDYKIKSIQINKFILCLRSNLFREMILHTFPFQKEIENQNENTKKKEKEKKNEKEKGKKIKNEKEKEKKNEKEKEKKIKIEKEKENKMEKEKVKENVKKIEKEKRKRKRKRKRKNRSNNQDTEYFTSIPEFYPFFLTEFYNFNFTPFTFNIEMKKKKQQ
ncbi:leucine rich repeat family protein [Anaeramoeba flamelloides]|uniref:Leucine rich repeat family protein n=1 Tax=Anaeramoeba flamelloides TaxID=1746091 RepID=A0AAV7ZNE6_9EUKA|nr:leucine rich repeat family protein [Anaeramoeba flamelloides]